MAVLLEHCRNRVLDVSDHHDLVKVINRRHGQASNAIVSLLLTSQLRLTSSARKIPFQ